jgi:multidrug resistance efflux pump
MGSDIPPRVRPEDFDALTAAMERCEASAIRVAETRKRLRLDETEEVRRLRAEVADLKRRVRIAREALSRHDSCQCDGAIETARAALAPRRKGVRR